LDQSAVNDATHSGGKKQENTPSFFGPNPPVAAAHWYSPDRPLALISGRFRAELQLDSRVRARVLELTLWKIGLTKNGEPDFVVTAVSGGQDNGGSTEQGRF
jgi:hypothetical protein